MKNALKYWWLVLIKGIILVLLSFYVFQHPVSILIGLAFYIGVSLLATGILLVVSAVSSTKSDENWGWKLAEGGIDVVFALILLSNPAVTASVFPFIVGFWMMVYGIMTFSNAFKAKKMGDSGWWMYLISGILTVVFGYFITVNLVLGAFTITFWIGLGFLLFGIVNIALSFRMKKLNAAVN